MEASSSSGLTAAPFGVSSARSCEETSSMAEFSCAIFSVRILRVLSKAFSSSYMNFGSFLIKSFLSAPASALLIWGAYIQPSAPTTIPPKTKPPTKILAVLGLPPSALACTVNGLLYFSAFEFLKSMSTITTTNQISASSRRRKPSSAAESPENPTPAAAKGPSRRVLFTEEDEIHLLKALKRATKLSSSAASPPPPLSSDFSDVQITDKLRRLRQRYHKLARTKSLMKTPRDRKIYEMGRKIWGKKLKKSRRESKSVEEEEEDGEFEEEVDLGDFPALMREVSGIFPENRVYREGLERLGREKLRSLNEKWMVQRMEEAGLLAKKAELFYEQTKLELQSSVVSSSIQSM